MSRRVLILMLSGLAFGQELVRNGGFEQPLDSGWVRTVSGSGTGTCDRDTGFFPDPDWEARDSIYDGPGWCRLSQVVPVPGIGLRFACDASLRNSYDIWQSAAAVSVVYLDSLNDTLGETRVCWPRDWMNWPPSDTLSIINAPDTAWHHYDIDIAGELVANLPGVDRSRIRSLSVGLLVYIHDGLYYRWARVHADDISLFCDTARRFVCCGVLPQRLEPGDSIAVRALLENVGSDTVASATGVLRSSDPRLRVVDSVGTYGAFAPRRQGANDSDRFVIIIDSAIPFGTRVPCTLLVSSPGDVDTLALAVNCGDSAALLPVPDRYLGGDRGWYMAFDDVDTGDLARPRFDWVEVADSGTRMELGDDQTVTIPLPIEYQWYYYYDAAYDSLSVCSNGWIAFGTTTSTSRANTRLPAPDLPDAVALFWDDLLPDSLTRICYWYDERGGRFIVEYDSILARNGEGRYKFELVIEGPGPVSENNMLLAQYALLGEVDSATVGIQAQSRGISLQCLFDGSYHRNAARLEPGRAVRYLDLWDVVADSRRDAPPPARIAVRPNPFRHSTTITLGGEAVRGTTVTIADAAGRQVRVLAVETGAPNVTWDGRDAAGRRAAPGVYFARAGARNCRLVLAR